MTRDARALVSLAAITLLLGGGALAVALLGRRHPGTEAPLGFWSLLSLGLAVTSSGFAAQVARQHGAGWLLLALDAALAVLAVRSFVHVT